MYTNRVNELCKGAGVSWYRVHKDTNIPRSTMRALHARTRNIPTTTTAHQLAEYFKVHPVELLTWVG